MAKSRSSRSDPFVSLRSLFDAVHGAIDFRESSSAEGIDVVIRLMNAPMMERLRRIKQLGYASHSYPSADHTRFGHAIGTLHIMRAMLRHLIEVNGLPAGLFKELNASFRKTFPTAKASERNMLRFRQHMLAAALLQDVGELPYGNATKNIYRPSMETRRAVAGSTGCDVDGWTKKDIFTVASLSEPRNVDFLTGLDREVLTFLITGSLPGDAAVALSLRAIRHLLDGVIDADRLDYVYRDAHHTVGSRGSPMAIIGALQYYDDQGPVFSDPVPVSEFLATRALLWTNVYFSPQNRFRTLLLTTLLQGIQEDADAAEWFFDRGPRGELSPDEFHVMDDVRLTSQIQQFSIETSSSGRRPLKSRLNRRAQTALAVLLGEAPDYECVWLSPHPAGSKPSRAPGVPDEVFFDTYSNYMDHSLYDSGSVRIESDRFQEVRSPIPLEDCSGPFNAMLKGRWSALPMPGSVLLFMPRGFRERSSARLRAAISDGALYDALMTMDPLDSVDFVADTRKEPGFAEPDIFISFAWDDLRIIEMVASVLRARRRRYYLLAKRYQGLGGTPGENSIKCVEDAGAVIVLASTGYVSRFQTNPNGNIAKELFAMGPRAKAGLPVIVLSADDHRSVASFPAALFGYDEMPFVGTPLRRASTSLVQEAVDCALEKIDAAAP